MEQTKRSFPARFFRWLFSWRILRRSCIALACTVTLIALVWNIENWRGQKAWQQYKAELASKGESVDWKDVAPPPVPDDKNLALAPLFQKLNFKLTTGGETNTQVLESVNMEAGDYPDEPKADRDQRQTNTVVDLALWQRFFRGNANYVSRPQPQSPAEDVLFALSKFDPVLNELRQAASERSQSQFPLRYEDNMSMILPHLGLIRRINQLLHVRSIALLELGRTDDAFEDIKLSFHLADSIKTERFLISYLVQIAIQSTTLRTVHEGLTRHQWKPEHLAYIADYCARTDMLSSYKQAMRGERALCLEGLEMTRTGKIPLSHLMAFANGGNRPNPAWLGIPSGWIQQNELSIARTFQDRFLNIVDETQRRISPERAAEGMAQFKREAITPYNMFAKLLVPALDKSSERAAKIQNYLNMAAIACALENHFQQNKQFPATLAELEGNFSDDVITGEPFKYKKTGDNFVLYSVGWNQKDDGGVQTIKEQGSENGDWLWGANPRPFTLLQPSSK